MTNHDMDWSMLDRYLSGRCTVEEIAAMQEWVARDPSNAHTLASVQRIWDESGIIAERFDAETAIRTLRSTRSTAELPVAAMETSKSRSRDASARSWRGRLNRKYMALAAAVLLTATGSVLVWQWYAHVGGVVADQAVGAPRVYATARGQRADILLADGTHVSLNVDSRLIIPANFGRETRQVALQGEAYFEVRHDAQRPFLVRSAGVVVEDLGTKFLVRAYPGETKATVTVGEGKVAVGRSTERNDDVTLAQGQHGEVDASGLVIVSSDVNIDNELAWRSGRLELRHVPLARAVRDLGRWYDIEISFTDSSLAQVPVTASFGSESVDDAMRVLATTLGARYAREGRQVRLMTGESP
jgi:transmembrane sensor